MRFLAQEFRIGKNAPVSPASPAIPAWSLMTQYDKSVIMQGEVERKFLFKAKILYRRNGDD